MGLFTYPVLQAADIVLYDADRVPVGDDQRQHLELARDVAIRFNRRFGDVLVVPTATIPTTGARVMDLQHPERKMSKSVSSPLGTVLMLDDPAEITRKVKKAVTDTDGEVRYDPEHKPGLSNLLELLAVATGRKPAEVAAGYTRYGDLKADTAEALVELLRPLQARRAELAADPGAVPALLARERPRPGRWPPPPTTGRRRRSACSARHDRGDTDRHRIGRGSRRGHRPSVRRTRPGRQRARRRRTVGVPAAVVPHLVAPAGPPLPWRRGRACCWWPAPPRRSPTGRCPRASPSWDSTWYLSIARGGYVRHIPPGSGNPAQSNLGFFPLVPVLTRATHEVTRFGIPVSGLITTFLLGLAAAVAVWWMLRDLFGKQGADRGTALVFFSPGALVLSLVYTEAATILMVACVLLALRRERWVVAGLCAAVATTADPVGSAVVVPCLVAAVLAIRAKRQWRALWAPVLAPVGIGAFFIYLWAHAGSPFEYFRAQRAGWQSGTYFNGIPGSFAHLFANWFADPDYAVKAVSARGGRGPPGHLLPGPAAGHLDRLRGRRAGLRGDLARHRGDAPAPPARVPTARRGRGQASPAVVRGGAGPVRAAHGHPRHDGHGYTDLDPVTEPTPRPRRTGAPPSGGGP